MTANSTADGVLISLWLSALLPNMQVLWCNVTCEGQHEDHHLFCMQIEDAQQSQVGWLFGRGGAQLGWLIG
jgi:hypothetical protein